MDQASPAGTISIRKLGIRDFGVSGFAYLAFFVYQYFAPQYFFPFLINLQIPKISVGLCILFTLIGWTRSRVKYAKPEVWSMIILGVIFLIDIFIVPSPISAKSVFNEHFHNVAVGFMLLYYFKTTNKINLIIVGLILFVTFDAFIAIREGGLIWGHDFLQDENQVSALMCMIIPVTIFYSLFAKRVFVKVMCYLALALQLAEIVLSFSRGGFVALVSVGLGMLAFTKRKLLFIVLIAVAAVAILQFAPDKFFSEMATLSEGTEDSTARARTEYWRRAIIMFTEDPLFGKGIAQFPTLSHLYVQQGTVPNETDYLVCHSNWFQILSELGIAGVLLYFIIFYTYFRSVYLIAVRSRKKAEEYMGSYEYSFYRNVAIGLGMGMLGFMVAGSFINILIFPFFYTYVFLMMLVKTVVMEKIQTAEASQAQSV